LKRKESDRIEERRVYCSAAAQSPPPAWPGTAIPEPSDFKTWEGPKPITVLGSTGSIGTQVYINFHHQNIYIYIYIYIIYIYSYLMVMEI